MESNIMKIFFSILKYEIFGQEPEEETRKAINFDVLKQLYSISNLHDMAHLISDALFKNGMLCEKNEVVEKFQKQQFTAVYRYEQIRLELQNLENVLEENKISFIPLKGSVIREYYPEPWMRTSCDIDILVHEEDLARATEILKSNLKYECGEKGSHDVSFMTPNGVHLELHYNLIEDSVSPECANVLSNIWSDAKKIKNCNYHKFISNEMFYFYHIAHMAKHFKNGGCGIRPFLDIAIMLKKMPFDSEILNKLFLNGKLSAFRYNCELLAEKWFFNGQCNEVVKMMEEYILTGGVYGNMENRVVVGQYKKGGRLKYILGRIFLPYENLKWHYPKLQKHRWLLPYYEVRRWCKLVFVKGLKSSAREIKTNINVSSQKAKKTAELLKELDL